MRRRPGPYGLAVAACLVLAGWALWSGGILDGPVARQVRTSSVYAAPGTGLDRAAAEQVIGDRRLVVVLTAPAADLRDTCDQVRRAAAGTLVLVARRAADGFDTYGCASFDGEFGKSFVAETVISRGIAGFADRALDAVKVVAVNYGLLVRAGSVPDGARTISPSLPRYLVAAAAVLAVLLGSALVHLAGRRAGRLAAARQERRAAAGDARARLSAGVAAVAQQILDLDGRPRPPAAQRRYLRLAAEYTKLLAEVDAPRPGLTERVTVLGEQLRALDSSPARTRNSSTRASR